MARLSSFGFVVLAIVGCNGDPNRTILDAAPGDGEADAPPDAPPAIAPVTVTIQTTGAAPAGIRVYFQNADSSVVAAGPLDQNNSAKAVMAAGGYVTVVEPGRSATAHSLSTWAGVQPGDHLILDRRSVATSVTFTVPLDPNNQPANYQLYTTCGNTTLPPPAVAAAVPISIPISLRNCGPNADVVVASLDASNRPLAAFSIVGQALSDGGTIDYTAQAYVAPVLHTYRLDNNPDPNSPIQLVDGFVTQRGIEFQAESLALGGSPAISRGQLPVTPVNAIGVVSIVQDVTNTERRYIEWGTTATYIRDWGAELLPDFAAMPALDPATHVVSWTATGGTLASDLSGVALSATRANDSWTWQMFGAASTSMTLPTVPTDVADFNITATDTSSVLTAVSAKVPGGWDALRATVFQGPQPSGATGAYSVTFAHQLAARQPAQRLAKDGVMRRWIAPQ